MLNINKKPGDVLTAADINNIGAAVDSIEINITEYNVSVRYPNGGIGGTYKYNLSTAIDKIPDFSRKPNIKCSFINEKDERKTFVWKGGTYTDEATWEEIVVGKSLSQLVDNVTKLDEAVFPLTLSVGGGGVFEKGTSQTITISWVLKKGQDITTPDSVTVNAQLATGNSKVFSGVTIDTTYNVEAKKGLSKKTGSTVVRFVNPSYLGVVANNFSATESGIKALTKSVSTSFVRTLSGATLVDQKVCYAYPKSFGALRTIKDANNFDYINSYQRTELTVNGEMYYVYVMKDASSITNFKQVFS